MIDLKPVLASAFQIPEALKKLGKAEMADTVLNVTQGAYEQMGENLKLKEEMNVLKEDLRMRDAEIKKLKEIAAFKEKLDYRNDCYWDEKGFALCSACLEKPSDPATIRMHTNGRTDGYAACPLCKNWVWSKGKPPTKISSFRGGLNSF